MAGERDPNIDKELVDELQRTIRAQDPVKRLTDQLRFQRELREGADGTFEKAILEGVGKIVDRTVRDLFTQPPYDDKWARGLSHPQSPPAIKQPTRDPWDAERKSAAERERKEREEANRRAQQAQQAQQDQDFLNKLASGPARVLIESRIEIPPGSPGYQDAARREYERIDKERDRGLLDRPQSLSQPSSGTPDYSIQSPPSVAGSSGVPSRRQIHPVTDPSNDYGWDTVKSFLIASSVLPLAAFGFLVWATVDYAQNKKPFTSPPPIPPGVSEKYSKDVGGNFRIVMKTPTHAPVSKPAPLIPTRVRGIILDGKSNRTPNAIGCGWRGGGGDHDPAELKRSVQTGKIVIATAGEGVVCVYSHDKPPVKDLDYVDYIE